MTLLVLGILPTTTATAVNVSTWEQLRNAVNGTAPVINVTDDITQGGDVIRIPSDRTVTIQSSAAGSRRTITQTADGRHFNVQGTLTLRQDITLTTTAGTPDGTVNRGGVVVDQASARFNMEPSVIIQNSRANRGGGVFVTSGGVFAMTGGTIQGNVAAGGGGAGGGGGVSVQVGTFTMSGTSTITNNREVSRNGGGGVQLIDTSGLGLVSTFNMDGGTISNNFAYGGGGGVSLFGINSRMNMTAGTISGNTAQSGSGGVSVSNGSFIMSGSGAKNITNNTGSSAGGVSSHGTFTMHDGALFSGNTSANVGGGMAIHAGTWNRTGTGTININNNTAGSTGGGVYVGGSHATTRTIPTNLAIGGNRARNGGGLAIEYNGVTRPMPTVTIPAGVTIGGTTGGTTATSRNEATGFGGGVWASACNVTLAGAGIGSAGTPSDTAPGNWAQQGGGGIAINSALLTISSGDIRGNFAGTDVGTHNRPGGGVWMGLGHYRSVPYRHFLHTRINMTGGTIRENRGSDGGGLFTSRHSYTNPLVAGSYPDIIALSVAGFSDNTATGGGFNPPVNAPAGWGQLLDNHNVNFRGVYTPASRLVTINAGVAGGVNATWNTTGLPTGWTRSANGQQLTRTINSGVNWSTVTWPTAANLSTHAGHTATMPTWPTGTVTRTGTYTYTVQWGDVVFIHVDGTGRGNVLTAADLAVIPAELLTGLRSIPLLPAASGATRRFIDETSSEWLAFDATEYWHAFGGEATAAQILRGSAHWGWFGATALDAENRTFQRTLAGNPATIVFRRPAVGAACRLTYWLNYGIPTTYADANGDLHVFGIWSLWGDANDDNTVDGLDIMAMNRFIANEAVRILNELFGLNDPLPYPGTVINVHAANVTLSGTIGGVDVTMVAMFIADEAVRILNELFGLNEPLPYGVILGQRPPPSP